ncbi:MAG: FAD-dependent monooxygenase [Alphaproteobacteria bacterium]|nr:FAD-dependent monooxygenase [Alphaproteobacteria bacterium]
MTFPRILIAGAGIGGLTAALALLRRGFDVDVYEQAAELKEVGAGVQISANGNRALFTLGLGEELKRLAVEADGKEIRLWTTGQTWKLFDLGAESIKRYGFPYLTVYRPDLHATLAAAVGAAKPGCIHLGAKAVGVDQDAAGVTLRLANGETAHGDALIGADGVHSVVRQALFGADAPQFTGVIAWRGVMPMDRLPQHMRRKVATNWVGPGGHVVHYPLHAGTLMNFVGIIERDDWRVESWNVRGEREECARDFRGWNRDVHAMIEAIDVPYKWALLSRKPMPAWTVGRVTLLGDASHAMLPLLAQGAVMAIEDGFILARCFEKYGEVQPALQAYETARRERANRCVVGSAAQAKRFHNQTLSDATQAEAYIDREWNEERVKERYEWLFQYDVTTEPI